MLIFIILVSLFANIDLIFSENIGHRCLIEGEKSSVANDCKLYLECIGGVLVKKSCSPGEIFNYKGRNCIRSSLSSFNCETKCNFTHFKPVKGNIKKYIYCENGIIKQGICEEYFDRFAKKCILLVGNNYLVNNENYYSSTQEKEKLINTCTQGMKKSVDGNCASYMECNESSVWVLHNCDECKNFEPKSMNCVWSWKYSCETPTVITTASPQSSTTTSPQSSTTTSPQSSTTTSPQSSTTTSPQPSSTTTTASPQSTTTSTRIPSTTSSTTTNKPNTHSTSNQSSSQSTPSSTPNTPTPSPTCKNQEKKVFKAGDCKDYLECDSNKWVKKTCSYGYDFDKNKLECTWSWWAKC